MGKLKRAAAAATALAMTASLAACADNRYVMKYDGEDINAGVYILNMYQEMSTQIAMLYYSQGVTEDYFSQMVEGKTLSKYLSDKAYSDTRDYAAVVKQFNALGLELTEDETAAISDQVKSMWDSYGELYEKLGVSKESAKLVYTAQKMDEKLFEYYYGPEGQEAVPDSDLETYVNDNYLRYKTISIYKSTSEDETVKADENKEKEETRDSFLESAQATDFAGFDDVITAYNEYLEAQNAEDTEESAEGGEEVVGPVAGETDEDSAAETTEESAAETTEDSAAETAEESAAETTEETSSIADEDFTAEEESKAVEAPQDAEETAAPEEETAEETVEEAAEETAEEATGETVEDATEETVSDEDTDSGVDLSSLDDGVVVADGDGEVDLSELTGTAEEEPDPYANETMTDYSALTAEELEDDNGKLLTFVKDLEVGKAAAYENDSCYYIVIRGDVSERSAEYVSENRDTVLHGLKDDEYRAKKDGWVDGISFTDNTSALKRYSPEAIYDREEKYYEDQKAANA